jgi:hypothetical protein
MSNLLIKINGESVEFDEDVNISFKKGIVDVNDINSRKGDYSFTFTIPLTSKNKRVFRFFYNKNERNRFIKSNFGVFPCQVFRGGNLIIDGVFKVRSINKRTTSIEEIEGNIISSVTEFSNLFDKTSLDQLSFSPKYALYGTELEEVTKIEPVSGIDQQSLSFVESLTNNDYINSVYDYTKDDLLLPFHARRGIYPLKSNQNPFVAQFGLDYLNINDFYPHVFPSASLNYQNYQREIGGLNNAYFTVRVKELVTDLINSGNINAPDFISINDMQVFHPDDVVYDGNKLFVNSVNGWFRIRVFNARNIVFPITSYRNTNGDPNNPFSTVFSDEVCKLNHARLLYSDGIEFHDLGDCTEQFPIESLQLGAHVLTLIKKGFDSVGWTVNLDNLSEEFANMFITLNEVKLPWKTMATSRVEMINKLRYFGLSGRSGGTNIRFYCSTYNLINSDKFDAGVVNRIPYYFSDDLLFGTNIRSNAVDSDTRDYDYQFSNKQQAFDNPIRLNIFVDSPRKFHCDLLKLQPDISTGHIENYPNIDFSNPYESLYVDNLNSGDEDLEWDGQVEPLGSGVGGGYVAPVTGRYKIKIRLDYTQEDDEFPAFESKISYSDREKVGFAIEVDADRFHQNDLGIALIKGSTPDVSLLNQHYDSNINTVNPNFGVINKFDLGNVVSFVSIFNYLSENTNYVNFEGVIGSALIKNISRINLEKNYFTTTVEDFSGQDYFSSNKSWKSLNNNDSNKSNFYVEVEVDLEEGEEISPYICIPKKYQDGGIQGFGNGMISTREIDPSDNLLDYQERFVVVGYDWNFDNEILNNQKLLFDVELISDEYSEFLSESDNLPNQAFYEFLTDFIKKNNLFFRIDNQSKTFSLFNSSSFFKSKRNYYKLDSTKIDYDTLKIKSIDTEINQNVNYNYINDSSFDDYIELGGDGSKGKLFLGNRNLSEDKQYLNVVKVASNNFNWGNDNGVGSSKIIPVINNGYFLVESDPNNSENHYTFDATYFTPEFLLQRPASEDFETKSGKKRFIHIDKEFASSYANGVTYDFFDVLQDNNVVQYNQMEKVYWKQFGANKHQGIFPAFPVKTFDWDSFIRKIYNTQLLNPSNEIWEFKAKLTNTDYTKMETNTYIRIAEDLFIIIEITGFDVQEKEFTQIKLLRV